MKRKISLKTFLIFINICVLIATFISFEVNYTNILIFSILFFLNILNILFLKIGFEQNNNFLKIYAFYFLHWYLPRFPYLLLNPKELLFSYLNFENFIYSLSILLIYHFFSGFFLILIGQKCSVKFDHNRETSLDKDFSPIFYWYGILFLVYLFNYYILEHGKDMFISSPTGFIFIIFSSQFIFIFLLFLIIFNFSQFNKNLKMKTIIFAIIYLIMVILKGSRSSIYQIIILFLFFHMVVHKNIQISINYKKILLIFLVGFFSIYSAYIGNVYRKIRLYPTETMPKIIKMPQYVKRYPLDLSAMINFISLRTSQFDYFYCVTTMDKKRYSHEINIVNAGKSTLNWLVPGSVFPGTLISSRLFQVDYLGSSIYESTNSYTTHVLGLLSFSIANFGILSGLSMSLALTMIYPIIFLLLFSIIKKSLRNYYLFFGYYFFYLMLNMMGYDHFIFNYYLLFLQVLVMLAFLFVYKAGKLNKSVNRKLKDL